MRCLLLTILVWVIAVTSLLAQNTTSSEISTPKKKNVQTTTVSTPKKQEKLTSTITASPSVFSSSGTNPTVSFTTTNISCNGGSDGCVNAIVSGATGNLGYLWSNGATSSNICGLTAGSYTVTVTDTIAAGPATLDTIYFETFQGTHNWNLTTSTGTNSATPNVWEVSDNEGGVAPTGCGVGGNGDNTLHITCTSLFCGTLISGALYNATQESNTRAESPVFSTVGYNNITFTFDYIANGDGLNDNASLLYNAGAGWQVLDPSLKTVVCAGGQGQWTAYSVTLPAVCDNNPTVQIAFNWTNNADNIGTDPSIAVNNTLLTSMGTGGSIQICTVVNDTTLVQPNTLVASIDTVAAAICAGSNNGFVNISVSGGTAPYTYNWSNGATTQDIAMLIDSTYIVSITDDNGCLAVDTAVVNTLGLIQIAVDSATNVGCNGDSTGAIYTTAIGDTAALSCFSATVVLNEIMYRPTNSNGVDPNTGEYIELIGPAGTDISCYVLTDGDWTITIPPGTTIPADGLFSIGNDVVLGAGTFDLDAENCNCFTEGTGGSALLILTDGGEFVALYDGAGTFIQGVIYGSPSTGNTPSNTVISTAGTAGCPSFVTIPNAPAFETASAGFANGTSLVRNPDGTGTWGPQVGGSLNNCNSSNASTNNVISYLWSTGDTTKDVSGLSAGMYTVTATNGYGCFATTSYTITEPALLVGTTNAIDVGCVGDSTGSIDLMISGGTTPYQFNWSNGNTTEDIAMLPVGNYCVTITDSSGCVTIACDTIEAPFFNVPVDTFYLCPGDSVQLQVNTNATVINWTPAGTLSNDTIANPFANPIATTTYVVNASVGATGANLVVNGDFEAGNVGFTSLYTYGGAIAGGYVIDTNPNIYNAFHSGYDHTTGMGNYLIADAAVGAVNVWCQTVNVMPNTNYDFSVWINNIITTTTFDDPTIELLINGVVVHNTGAIPELPDVWVNHSTTWNSTTNTAATLCIRAVGASSSGHDFGLDDISFSGPPCVMTDSVIVIVDSLDVTLGMVTNVLCKGDTTGSVSTSIVGSGYTYLWNTGDTTTGLNNIGAGTYNLTVSNVTGACQDTLTVMVAEPDSALMLSLATSTNVTCFGDSTGQITVNALGGTSPYAYSWSNTATAASLTGLEAGPYVVTLTDDNGCAEVLSVIITEPTEISVTYNGTPVSCNGTNDGTAMAGPVGGTPGYSYLWEATAGSQTTATATGLASSTYSVTVTDSEGCVAIANSIFVGTSIPIDSNNVPLVVYTGSVACDQAPIGSLGINTMSTYTYLWSNGATDQTLTNLPAGSYTVTITNGLGCTNIQSGTIGSPFIPNVNPFITTVGMTSTTVTSGTTVNINGGNDQSGQGVTYLWTTASADVTFGNDTDHATTAMSPVTGVYVLTITATAGDSTACQDTGSVTLNVESVYDGMPTIFTPNGDGVNDLYRPVGLTGADIITFKVYNRWGQEVYNGDNLENMGWDGRFRGVEQPTEVYIFLLEYKLGANAEPQIRKGDFTLVR